MRCAVYCGDGDTNTYILLNAINQNYPKHKQMELFKVEDDRWSLVSFAVKHAMQGIVYFLPIRREADKKEWFDIAREIWRIDYTAYTLFVYSEHMASVDLAGTHIYDCIRYPLKMLRMKEVLSELRWDRERRSGMPNVLVKEESHLTLVSQSSICYCSRDRDHIVAHTDNGEMRWRESFQSLLGRMSGDLFVRIHNGYIVNRTHICTIDIKEKCVVLTNGEKVPYSRRNEKKLKDLLRHER